MTANIEANQMRYRHDEVLGKASHILSSDPHRWEEEAEKAIKKEQTLIVHPQFLLDLLSELDAAKESNKGYQRRFAEAMKKLTE